LNKAILLLSLLLTQAVLPQAFAFESDVFEFSNQSVNAPQKHDDRLNYTDFEKYFQLGEVEFTRATGFYQGREADMEVIVANNYPFEVCLVPTYEVIKNGRVELFEPNFIHPAKTSVNIGNYGADVFGKSWHIKWNFLVSQNLEKCVI
jgi:hypothetical protein